jgi:hypothetical protein
VNGRELDGLSEKASKKTNGAQRTFALHTEETVVFCASEIGEVARESQHHHGKALEKSSQHFYKKFAGINKLTAAFEIWLGTVFCAQRKSPQLLSVFLLLVGLLVCSLKLFFVVC